MPNLEERCLEFVMVFKCYVKWALLPGALARNNNQRFSCKDVYLKVESTTSALTCGLQGGEVLRIPIAHAEGRYVISDQVFRLLMIITKL